MRVLVLGAGGFIGAHAAAALRAAGHEVLPGRIDFTRALRPEDWLASLQGVDAVVNSVGIFRDQDFEKLHTLAPRALFEACVRAGVRRVVQISALGADEAAQSRFHRTKRAAHQYLATLDLDWAIVQPSLVFGEGGASARLFALLAALPVTPLPGDGRQRVQPIHVDDLAQAVAKLVASPSRAIVPAVGPREITLRDWLELLRSQMKLGRARFIAVPRPLLPLDRETLGMLDRGNTASPEAITRLLGRAPRDAKDFEAKGFALRARLAWLLPLLRASIGIVWIASGVLSLGIYPVDDSYEMLQRVGVTGALATLALYGAAMLDIALGVATFLLRRRWLWRLQIGLILAYSGIIAVWLPEFWLHPFGPVLKNLPILAA